MGLRVSPIECKLSTKWRLTSFLPSSSSRSSSQRFRSSPFSSISALQETSSSSSSTATLPVCNRTESVADSASEESKPTNQINYSSLMKLVEHSLHSSVTNGQSTAAAAPLFTQFHGFIDLDICNSMIRHYADHKEHLHSIFVFREMLKVGILPDLSTFPAVLKSVARKCLGEIGLAIHGCSIKMGYDSDVYVGTSLINVNASIGDVEHARKLFDEMPSRNSVSWNALITCYTHNRKFKEALEVFREMQASGAEPTEVTMVGVLSASAHLGALSQGRWIHEYINSSNLRLNVFLGTALIDMYAKCGVMNEMERVFCAMRVKNVFTWNVLISGFAMNGCGDAALQAFSRMRTENLRPDGVTFLGVLCACCHEGFVDSGKRYFTMMKEEFGLRPGIEHYGCLVDLLGRAGLFAEAHELIQNMNLKPDPIIWRAFLGACRIHGNTPLVEVAIRNLLELEPNNGENYVLLSNLYARARRWADMERLRLTMSQRGIRKIPGCSSIEVDDTIYEFVASESVRSDFQELYNVLNDMNGELKLAGYAANTDLVIYDLEEEEKEHSLQFHSEKLALAFGISKSPSGSTIRIVKNLRACQDCHGFFKLVSLVYKRKISLRDRNRFHHFEGGSCSCKDYW